MEGCESGCKHFSCGSIGHNKSCQNYPGSMQNIIDQQSEEIELLKNKAVKKQREQDFKDQYQVTFLASWTASNYNDYCINGQQEALSHPPAEDAIFLADEAWKALQDV
jgi:hypothetical protein